MIDVMARGLHPHGPREGPARAARDHAATACAARSRRSSRCSGSTSGCCSAGNAILTETVFNIPGVGAETFDAIKRSDLPMIQGIILFGAFFIVTLNLVVDIAYAYLDPRVRYQ